jgi:putative CocE/NonD family hydrolase
VFWKARNLRAHLKAIRPAVMTVGGWFDAENLFGALETYRSIEASTPGSVNRLVMGPWHHGGWNRGTGEALGHVRFNSKTSPFYAEHIEFPFFEHHLKEKANSRLPEAWVFATGTNEWRDYSSWPPRDAKPKALYFHSGGRLAFAQPSAADDDAHDEYVSDPAKPVPFLGEIAVDMKKEYMVADQRFAARRTDVLTYVTDELDQDLTLVGPVVAKLHVATSGTDSDWVVKLIDVYPDDYPDPQPNPSGVKMGGYQQLVRGDVMRGKFRESLESPERFTPNRPTPVSLRLQDIHHTFRPGHRVMVQVQSTWFPLVDRNPQTFVDIYSATEADFQKATQRVYRSPGRASHLEVLVLP